MNKPIKIGSLVLLSDLVVMIFEVEYRQQELLAFFNDSSPLIPMLTGGLVWAGIITVIVGVVLKFKRTKNNTTPKRF